MSEAARTRGREEADTAVEDERRRKSVRVEPRRTDEDDGDDGMEDESGIQDREKRV